MGVAGPQMASESLTAGMLATPPTPAPMEGRATGAGMSVGSNTVDNSNIGAPTVNRRVNYEKWVEEERLGERSTIAPVLYSNITHPDMRTRYPDPRVRTREIQKAWRRLPSTERSRYVVNYSPSKSYSIFKI